MEEIFKDDLDQQPMARLLSASADITSSREPIAIIGMGCHFPGANSPKDFWQLLCNEVDAITEVPADRFPIDAFYDPRPGLVGKTVTRWGGFLDGIDQFDASFFGISPHAASRMDPQYRLLLEVAWEALEDAGITRAQLVGSKTGVFIGMTTGDYQDLQCRNTEDIDVYVVTGGLRSVASGRISYAFDLQGPSLVVDTACTSSLTALHLACQSLRAGECPLALVGGSHLILQPELTLGFSAAGMMSPDGHCKFGDASANGYVRSEGVGVLVLKPLGQALADGDPIQALIRGSATNNDGRSGRSLVTPGYKAQVAVLREAYRDANVLPSQVQYVEAHGTGTRVGDGVEIRALATVLAEGRALDHPCHIGSVKTNIGHTEGAAGMAGLIKAVLCLKHRALPKSLHCENLNSVLSKSEVPLVIQQTLESLAEQDEPILVGVSAFGVSGTNAHIILEEAKQHALDVTKNDASDGAFLLPLSAHTSEALTALAQSYQAFAPEYALADVCYTAAVRRTHHAHRVALVVRSYEELHAQLESFLQGRADPNVAFGHVRSGIPQQSLVELTQIEMELPSLRHGEDEHTNLLRSLASLYTLGCPIAWSKLYPTASRCVSLPSYPWQHEHFWMKTDTRGAYNRPPVDEGQRDVLSHPLLGYHWTSAVHSDTHYWDMHLSTDLFPYLNDHHVQGAVVLPAAAYAEIVLAAAREVFHIVPVLKDITFKKAIFLPDIKEKRVQLVLTLERPGVATFQFFSQEESSGTGQTTWIFHASGMAITDLSAMQLGAFQCETPEQIQARCQQVYTGQKYYQSLALRGFRYGPCFQTIAEIARRDGEALARIQLVEQVVADSGAYLVHPALLDGCFQAILAALPENMSKTATYVLVRLKSLQISDHLGQRLWSHAVLREVCDDKPDIIEGDVFLLDEQGQVASASLELIGKQIEDVKEENHLRDWLYEWHWEARPWSQIDRSSQKLPQGPWLIFADRLGIGEQLSRLLTVPGRDCVLAFRGTSYQQLTPQRYLLQSSSPQDFQQLLRDASSASGPFCGIIHLWSIDAHPATVKTSTSIEEAQQTGVLSIMNLVQAMASLGGDRSPLLWLVTCGAQPVTQSNDAFSVEQAPVSGLGRVLVNEHPELQCRRIDLERADVSTQAQLLFWELQVGDREDEVALSKEARLVHRLVRCETDVVTNKPSLFRPDATYLIAGGLGGLGLTVADWMVRQGARYLVLVGRSGPSSEADQVITTLQEMGAQVVIAKADISEEQEVADLLTTMQTSLPPLRGLIHAAAVLDDGVLLRQDAQRFHKVIAPKIKGAWNLHTLTAHLQLDFFVLFSSAATLLGLPGQSNYVAANEFLDVLAHYRRRLGLSALSINWGTWSEVGMAASRTGASPVPTSERLALRGMSSLTPQQGLDALTYLLSQDRPQVAVMSVDWSQWHLFYPEFADSPLLAHLMAQSRAMTHAIVQAAQETLQTPILATQPEDRLELVTHYLDRQISQALGLGAEKSNRDLPLIEQGLDSLMAVELKNKIQAGLGVSVTVTKLLETASTIQLAQDIFEQLQTAFTHQLADKFGKNNEQPKVVQLDPKLVFAKKPSLATIKKRKETLPLSSAQQRLWFLDKMFPGSTNYNVPVIVRLTGSLNIHALQQSLQEIIQRHEVLRTTFEAANGQPVQVISSDASLSLPLVDLCACQLEKREQTAMQLATEEAQQRLFDLERGPSFRAQLLYLGPSQYWLLITVHHIVFDVWSLGVMLRELSALYTSRVLGQPSLLADLPLQYGDYTLWQHKQMRGKLLDDQLAYWKEHLAGAPLVLELPTDHPRPTVQSYRGTRFFFRFPPSLMERVADLSRREGVTLFMTMLAAWQIVLGHTSQQEDFLVGSPIAGRQRMELEKLIGFFVNTLVLRAQLAGHMTFRDLLKQVKQTTLVAYEHQDVPFEQLVEMLHPPRDLSRSPIFQVMFALQNMPLPPLELHGLSAIASEGPCTTSRFDLFINLWEKADFDHWIEYPTDLFEEGTIARIVEHYQRVLEQVVLDADLPISRMSLLTEHERQKVISDWNATQIDYSRPGWIHQWISEQAQRTPDASALFFEQEVMTYQLLEQCSNQLGHYLQQLGVGPEQRVGIYLERSFTLVLALLAVLKAGGAYVPLDTGYPSERLEYMLKDGQVSLLLTQASLHGRLSGFEGNALVLDEIWEVISQESEALVSSQVSGQNLAYVIYTSGSTGLPKGVMNTHEGLANCLNWMQDTFGMTPTDRVLQRTSISFDVSVGEIFCPLMSGAGLVLVQPGEQQDLLYMQELLASAGITIVNFVPSMLQAYLQLLETSPGPDTQLRYVISTGEALSSATLARYEQLWGVPLFNLYGPTETTIEAAWWPCSQQREKQQTVPIGHPLANTQIYLLDKYGELLPVGVAGEMYIGGVQVALGYLHRPDLTAERFVPNPFQAGERLYRTGDLARYQSDGTIEYLGRIDQQVKIHGFRIELGEIEAVLHTHPGVRDAVIVTYEDDPINKKLVAYVILEDSTGSAQGTTPTATLQDWLRKKVPDYMVPSVFISLEAFPFTASGKLDRRSLPQPTYQRLEHTPVPPRTETEHQLSKIFADLLSLETVGVEDSLFDLGFHSLLVTRAAARIRETLQVDVPPPLFFKHWTIERLAQYLQTTYTTASPDLHSTTAEMVTREEFALGAVTADKILPIEASPVVPQQHSLLDHVSEQKAHTETEPIAIIGMSGAFPQAPDVQSLWNNLLAGRDCIGEIPASRWDWQAYPGDPTHSNPERMNVKWAGVMEDVEAFDPQFFGISPHEAELMDPQQRFLMMYVWKAIEDAGYSAESLSGTDTALFVGTVNTGYSERASRHLGTEGYSATGLVASLGPSRMSYFLNLHGPSEPIETACSSSLVAIHRGVNAIESGQCSMAIVGGVNILASPEVHISFSKAGMLSADGRCKAFSAQANGYVRGEGVGMLLLKKLSLAEQAGDHIYGVIRGTAENHGGRASSLTAPNPQAQTDLLIAAYRKAGIDPRTVGYIEAHGTGTELGDPIEINGLKSAWSELSEMIGEGPMQAGVCGIGSIKSNIGHLELAAGITGAIKVLLQIQHKQLMKSLHCEQLNPYLQLEGSPFYIVQENREWMALQDQDGNTLPRRAGVSSFGFGGVNAHVILEEYVEKHRALPNGDIKSVGEGSIQGTVPLPRQSRPALVVLSARTQEQLHMQAQHLFDWVQAGRCTEEDLVDLTYTLQVGREAMRKRLALQVRSLAELKEKLRKYLQDPKESEDWYIGHVEKKDTTVECMEDEDGQRAIEAWMSKGKYEKLLAFWVKGLAIDWTRLYIVGAGLAPARPRRISLPTYPFAHERYWVSTPTIGTVPCACLTAATTVVPLTALHPLVQRNTSTLWKQQFNSIFHGDEFFLADHVISGQRIMPAVAYLEMARAAVREAIGDNMILESSQFHLRDVVWIRPLIVSSHPVTVRIVLDAQEGGTISFVVSEGGQQSRTAPMGEETEERIYCQGVALVGPTHTLQSPSQSLDLPTVQSHCQHQISVSECYQRYRELGVTYGPTMQAIEQLSVGGGEVLARFRLPVGVVSCAAPGLAPGVAQTHGDFVLHPSVLDAALQARIGLLIEQPEPKDFSLPFALSELSIMGQVKASGWVWISRRQGSIGESIFDIDVCDDEGQIAVRMRGLSTRRPPSGSLEPLRTVPLTSDWKEETIVSSRKSEDAAILPPPPIVRDLPNILASYPLEQENLRERASTYFRKQLAALIKLPVQQIDTQAELSDYGFDSILAIRFISALEDAFGPLPKTLLFEYSTVQSLTEYFLQSYPEQLRSILGIEEAPAAVLSQVTGERIANERVGTGPAPVRMHVNSTDLRTGASPVPTRFMAFASVLGASPVPTDVSTRDGQAQRDKEAEVGDIAIIGVAGRYPGARDLRAFWENLRNGRDCITEIPASRWDYRLYFDADKNKPGTTYSKWGGFLDGVDEFDPLFFNISPREAELMDPQERLFLECVHATLEDAGYTREELSGHRSNGLSGNVGVFVGVMYGEYPLFAAQAQIQGKPIVLSGSFSSIANRVSYVCNFHGPSMAVDTMCSSSLTAIHLACHSIKRGECGLAIAGGVNVSIHPNKYLFLAQGKYVSSQGSCQSFGLGADGYVPAEGVGAVLLKPLAQAKADGDHIYAVIKATAINHGGKTNGYTIPNPQAQAGVIRQALTDAHIDPRTITYVEAHGTGTVLGDPIEIAGLTRAFQDGGLASSPSSPVSAPQWCAIGSVKSNIGHAESAAGIAGVTKVLLQMRHGQLVPSLHSEVLNPHIDFNVTPFVVQQELSQWKRLQVPGTSEGRGLPRRAGVSSFGAGGSNVHVVLEEYVERQQASNGRNVRSSGPVLIVLSARTREQLTEQVQQLLLWLQGEETALLSAEEPVELLDNLAYTLQVGREAMEERLAIQVSSLTELEEQLYKYLQDPQEAVDWYQGQVKPHKEVVGLFGTDKELNAIVGKWLQQGQYDKVLQWWVKGLKISWYLLYPVTHPCRISLPTYPFARERYWVPTEVNSLPTPPIGNGQASLWGGALGSTTLHPLVQRNTSTLWEQQFSSTFYGDEFFLADHVISGQRILPAVAYLEMARVAVREAISANEILESSQIRLSNVVWLRPLIVSSHPVTVHIVLEAQENGTISFVVKREGEEAEEHIYCQGSALVELVGAGLAPSGVGILGKETDPPRDRGFPRPSDPFPHEKPLSAPANHSLAGSEDPLSLQPPKYLPLRAGLAPAHERQTPVQSLDLPALQSRCQRQILASDCYQRYRELGITYGPAFQAIEQLRGGEGEAIARFRLPSVVAQTQTEGGYVLHPSVLDAALHASIGLFREQDRQLQVPFALSDLSIVGEVKASGWARVAWRQGSTEESLLDIEVCDDEGRIAVRMSGLSTRAFLAGSSESLRTALLTPDWKEETLVSSRSSEETAMHPPSLIVLCDLPESLASRIQAELAVDGHSRSLSIGMPTGPSSASQAQLQRAQRFQEALVQLIQELQRLWSKPKGITPPPAVPFLVQVVVAHREEPSFFEALIGVLKTAQQEEYPNLQGQLIEVDGELEEEELLALLRENQYRPQESHIRYQNDKRWVRQWREIDHIPVGVGGGVEQGGGLASTPFTSNYVPWKEGGCYLITGGAGGLARLFVQEIFRQVQNATILLVGRSALSTEQRADLVDCGRKQAPTLQAPQAETGSIHIDYQQVDVTDGPAVHALIQGILAQYGHLDGIIHAAGVLRDSLVRNKTPEGMQAVLAPKVVGVEHLDEASSQIPLDFFVLCSSLAAVVGNVGQADYASANAYLDAFAYARAAKVRAGERQGVTVSINWPFWGEGGMRITAEQIQMMREQMGIEVMETETGMKMLYQALACGQAQVLVIYGQIERIKQRVLGQASDLPVGSGQVQVDRDTPLPLQVPLDRLREALRHMVSDLLKVQVEQIDAEAALTEYGFDSITFTGFANHLNQTYQLDLAPPVFFEYSTIESLARYLRATYASVLAPHFTTGSPLAPDVAQKDFVSETPRVTEQMSPVRQRPRATRWLLSMEDAKATAAVTPIAIIGMSGAFPQAPDVQSLWRNLLAGCDCIGEIPQDRWDWQTYFGSSTSEASKTDIKWAGVLASIELFDPLFFGISPREAELMDPQQRLLMMHVWKAIEDAGYDASSLSGTNTALFIGTGSSGYGEQASRAHMEVGGYFSTGLAPSMGPGRISYFLNLHGPSEAIDTACSSSLVAIHRGVNAIENGQCTVAIVGGVNILVSPEEHISFSNAGMLSSDGRCKTFSAQANGYVRAEGIGMLVLKKLSEAEQAGDHIYGVIHGSAENHGGRASSLTAPNPRAQADLLVAAYRKAGIDPRTVSYIEAHGTGTPLGDPIEINGLKSAWSELSETIGEGPMQEAICGIGSVKSNIGHLERAAGVVGVIKVLLQLQHKQLVKSLHYEPINPYIELKGSPFYIVQENREWEALRDQMGNPLPRRAGVSSFGFSGANAHVVLEEYVPGLRTPHPQSQPQPPALIVLSARTQERLKEQVQQLLLWIQGEEAGLLSAKEPVRLDNLAYTLQVGREAMEERLAIQTSSLTDLVEKLRKYLQDPQEAVAWYRGQVRPHKEVVELFSTEKELQAITERWLQQGQYDRILQWWVKGLKISWHLLYGEQRPHRISLPTYPFARERYWIPMGVSPMATPSVGAHQTKWDRAGDHKGTLLRDGWHPLVQHNTSTLWEQQFSSTFYGDEFFLADHVIKGQRILPAVAYLEMARAAVREAIGDGEMLEPSQVRLSNIVWMRPLIVSSQPVTVRIALEAQENGTISFVVKGEKQGEEAEEQIYCQGRALVGQDHEQQSPIQNLDLPALQSRCQHQIPVSEYYQRYRELGITYGPAMQAIEQLSVGEGVVLARLRLPVGVVPCAAPGLVPGEAQTRTEEGCRDRACPCPLPYVLHPSMLDAALQACLGLVIGQPGIQELSLPFALSELSIMGEVKASGWAWLTRRQRSTGESVLDIEVCDDEGRVVVHMRDLSTRAFLPGNSESPQASLRIPDWKEETLVSSLPSLDHIPVREIQRTDESLQSSQSLQIPIDELREALTHMVSDLLKVQVKQIDAKTELTEYGFDSITFMALANRLNLTYQLDLSPSLLFEHSTLESLARYLQTTYASVLAPHFATGSPAALRLALEGTHKELLPDKMPSISTSPMTTVPRRRSRVARSLLQVSEGEINEMLLAASHTRQAGHEAIEERLTLLEKEVPKPTLYRTDTYSIILAPNPSFLTGAGTNTIVLGDQRTGAVVIDPATDDPEYLSEIIQEGQRYSGIRRILTTHGHFDHIGGAEALRAQLSVPILAFSKKSVPFADEEIADNTLFPIGDDMLRAIHTPGHCSDHLCFWLEKQRILFAGDLVTNSGPSFLFPPPEGDLQEYMHSLERVQHLESVKIIPAHGETILRPQELLAECLARCQEGKQHILALVYNASQGIDIKTIVQVLYSNIDASLYDFMSISILLNLSLLEREGQVKHIENKQSEQKDYWIFTGERQ